MFSADRVACWIALILSLQLSILNHVAGSGLTDLDLDPHRGIATYPLIRPYTVYRKSMNWQDAINHCESSQSQLAVFINPGTAQNIVNNISRVSAKPTNSYIDGKMKVEFGRDRCYWIGLHTDHQLPGKWRWLNTSEILNYNTFWPEGHLDRMDKTANTQRCVALCNPNYTAGKNHMFYHNSCLSKFYFICQAKPRTRIASKAVGGAKDGRSIGIHSGKNLPWKPFKERSRRRYKKLHTTTEPPFSEEVTTKSANDYENPFGSHEKVPTTTTTPSATHIMMIHPRALRKHPGFHKLFKQTTSEEVHLAKLKFKRIKTTTTTTTATTKVATTIKATAPTTTTIAQETASISKKGLLTYTTSDRSTSTEETTLKQGLLSVLGLSGLFGGRRISGRGIASFRTIRNRGPSTEFPPSTTSDSSKTTEETTLSQSASERAKNKKSFPVMPKGGRSIGRFGGRGISGRGIAFIRPLGNRNLSPTSENPENSSTTYVTTEGSSVHMKKDYNSKQITTQNDLANITVEHTLDLTDSFSSTKDKADWQNQAESTAAISKISSSSSRYGRSHKIESRPVGLIEKLSPVRKRKDPLLTIIRLAARLARIPAIKRRLEMTQSGEQDLEFVEDYLANVYASSTLNPSGVNGRSAPVGPLEKDNVMSLGVPSEYSTFNLSPAVKLKGKSSQAEKKLEPVQQKPSSRDSEMAQLPKSSGSRETTTSTPSLIIEIETFTQPATELPYVDAPATIQPTTESYYSSDNDATTTPSFSDVITLETAILPPMNISSDASPDDETTTEPDNSFQTTITIASIESITSLEPEERAESTTVNILQPNTPFGLSDNSVPFDSQFLNPKVLKNTFSLPLLPKNPSGRGFKSTRKKDPVLTIIKLALKLSALPRVKEMLDASESGEHDLSAIEQYLQILQMQKRMRSLMGLEKVSILKSATGTNVELNGREQMAAPNNGTTALKLLHAKQELDAMAKITTSMSSVLMDDPADIPNVDAIIETIETQLRRTDAMTESTKPTAQVGENINDLAQPKEEVADDDIAPEDMFMEMIDNSNLVKRGVGQLNDTAAIMKIIKLTQNVVEGSNENPMENEV